MILRWLDRCAPLLAVVGLIGLGIVYVDEAHSRASQASLREVERGSCVRLNILRADDNADWLTAYRILVKVGLKHDAAQLHWIPLTDCDRALTRPSTFVPPGPVDFSTRLPSAADLSF